jgi:signal peptidase II
LKKAILTILGILVLDQWLKIWVKLNFYYGESKTIIDGWFDLQFVENPGMAFGWMLPGEAGKLILSIFRLLVVGGISVYLYRLVKQKAHWGYVMCVSMIVAGALGNIIDSAVYGLMFDRGSTFDPELHDFTMYFGKAQLNYEGYANPLMGNVVDMFHLTKRITWGESSFELFPPIFNVADASITAGIIVILLFQRRFFKKDELVVNDPEEASSEMTATSSSVADQNSDEPTQWPTRGKEDAD